MAFHLHKTPTTVVTYTHKISLLFPFKNNEDIDMRFCWHRTFRFYFFDNFINNSY